MTGKPLSSPRMGVWTDERVELLRKLWSEGLSCSQIARRLGVSRNAAIGKGHRLGLAARAKPSPPQRIGYKPRVRTPQLPGDAEIRGRLLAKARKGADPKPTTLRPQAKVFGETKVKTAGIKPMSWGSAVPIPNPEDRPAPIRERPEHWKPLPGVEPITLLQLGNLSCKWPIKGQTDDEHLFCGAMKIGGPYCIHHAGVARSKSQPAPSAAEPFHRTRRAA